MVRNINVKFLLMTMSIALITIFSAPLAFADSPSKKNQCPSVEAIKQVGLNDVRLLADSTWAAANLRNNYGTSFEWTFVLGSDYKKVKNLDEARQRAMQELQTLTFESGPHYNEAGDAACIFNTNRIKGVIAITPPLKVFHNFFKYN